ncbi:hypothetical protein FA10DRAFT_286032 [Acaromyces ingoldii]|uniref:Yeast cell wall synthesis Kre9/Knh1-like N-terminal domain-containing protein n=1 Tax=Acaromyces ingoldii TaxID=215250 RepID=A0A316YM97_9BASI|nr:hypothetical protein FA10DRAFT_286032 [Acaromyces ingoldii]PWN90321.1 hypothetical protein FA10DRAFT_286032 [Acaromyces ingoldii]
MSPATLLCFFLQAFAALAQSPQMPTVTTEGGHMASVKHENSMSNGGAIEISILEPNGNTKWTTGANEKVSWSGSNPKTISVVLKHNSTAIHSKPTVLANKVSSSSNEAAVNINDVKPAKDYYIEVFEGDNTEGKPIATSSAFEIIAKPSTLSSDEAHIMPVPSTNTTSYNGKPREGTTLNPTMSHAEAQPQNGNTEDGNTISTFNTVGRTANSTAPVLPIHKSSSARTPTANQVILHVATVVALVTLTFVL